MKGFARQFLHLASGTSKKAASLPDKSKRKNFFFCRIAAYRDRQRKIKAVRKDRERRERDGGNKTEKKQQNNSFYPASLVTLGMLAVCRLHFIATRLEEWGEADVKQLRRNFSSARTKQTKPKADAKCFWLYRVEHTRVRRLSRMWCCLS